jgi:RNA polymerase sigma-70 factor (ECF subfamily)
MDDSQDRDPENGRAGDGSPGAPAIADADRIEAYLHGDSASFRELDGWIRREVEMRYPVLRGEADDICQTVHQKLLMNLRQGRFSGRSTLRTYVTAMAHHTAIDRLRRVYRDRALAVELPREGSSESPYTLLVALEERRILRQVVLLVPPACRLLWRMVLLDRLAYTQIAERLSIPPGTVKSRMWHCRRRALDLVERLRGRRSD